MIITLHYAITLDELVKHYYQTESKSFFIISPGGLLKSCSRTVKKHFAGLRYLYVYKSKSKLFLLSFTTSNLKTNKSENQSSLLLNFIILIEN